MLRLPIFSGPSIIALYNSVVYHTPFSDKRSGEYKIISLHKKNVSSLLITSLYNLDSEEVMVFPIQNNSRFYSMFHP